MLHAKSIIHYHPPPPKQNLSHLYCKYFISFQLGGNYEPILNESIYKIDMTLRIRSIGPADYGAYKCVAKNSLGETDSTIKVYSKLKLKRARALLFSWPEERTCRRFSVKKEAFSFDSIIMEATIGIFPMSVDLFCVDYFPLIKFMLLGSMTISIWAFFHVFFSTEHELLCDSDKKYWKHFVIFGCNFSREMRNNFSPFLKIEIPSNTINSIETQEKAYRGTFCGHPHFDLLK